MMPNDLRSKFVDGLLGFFIIFMAMGALIVLIRVMEPLGHGGIIAYVVGAFLLGLWCLGRSCNEKHSDVQRAWLGIIGGLFTWTSAELSHELGFVAIGDWHGLVLMVIACSTGAVLWRFLPLGPRFWFAAIGMDWIGHMILTVQSDLITTPSIERGALIATGVLSALIFAGAGVYIFARSSGRVARLWCAIWLWISLATFVFVCRNLGRLSLD
jgi:hypothetical protein